MVSVTCILVYISHKMYSTCLPLYNVNSFHVSDTGRSRKWTGSKTKNLDRMVFHDFGQIGCICAHKLVTPPSASGCCV